MPRTRLLVAGAILLSAVTAHAAGKITVTLDGKAVTAVPVTAAFSAPSTLSIRAR